MAKVKVINSQLTGNLSGSNFNDTPSNTIFSFGSFFVTSNFDDKTTISYTNSLSSFVRPVTLETMGVSDTQSDIIHEYTTNAVLNLDKSDLNTFVRYGSAYEFLRVSIQNIILAYPGSLFCNSQKMDSTKSFTYTGLIYDETTDISTFYVPTGNTVNTFGLVYNNGNESLPDDNELKNLNISYEKYVIWSSFEPDTLFKIVGYTGNTINTAGYYPSGTTGSTPFKLEDYLKLQVSGNPFALLTDSDNANIDFHIRPNNVVFEEFRALLNIYEQNIVSQRDGTNGFIFTLKEPTLLDDGKIIYSDSKNLWVTGDGYNIDINTPRYQRFLEIILIIGAKYDKIKTDLIARFLTPASLKTYDFTDEGKITKLLRIYGREFDQIRQFIDSLVNINKVTYDKLNNIPDQLVKNMARTFGWNYFSLVNETELVEGFLTVDDTERNLNENILPAEIDIELWRRIINNTSYFWKSKGTRQAIKSMFLLIGIPEPFINITEYVYTVDGKIDPNTVTLAQGDFPSNSLPYDTSGYPVAPLETDDFYFQLSGNSDSGQAYLDVFRNAGFNLKQTPDNKKSWIQTGATTRVHYSTPQYYQEDSKLVINTKEVDVALDTARGIEYDVYQYILDDFAVNSSGYTLPYSYVNISNVTHIANNVFELPISFNYNYVGDLEVRYNGILLNAPSTGDTSGYTSGNTITEEADYFVSGNTIIIPELSGGTRDSDVIQVTFVNSGATTLTGLTMTVKYIVTRVKARFGGTYIPLPSFPRGDVQLTINGIALTKGTPQFIADYILDPANSTGGTNQIIIQNPDVISYLNQNPNVQISYLQVENSNDVNLRSEIARIDSFNSSKIYFNDSANKYVYKLNYKVNNASEVKFLIDGIALEPNMDYSINVQNPYEIFLPKSIRYGTVISAYYLVGGAGAFNPVVADSFGLGDISQLSFLEFLELIQRKMINARNRKTVTDFKGGWYPTLLRIYETYLERALLSDSNPLQSNGYTFMNLYPFLSKYNAFFQRFVDQLLPTTIIIKRGGLLIRNSVFTKQKHWYKRGVNVSIDGITNISGTSTGYLDRITNRALLQYFGDDGSKFQIAQEISIPTPPTQLYVETIPGVIGSIITGGRNIIGFTELNLYGIEYRTGSNTWIRMSRTTPLVVDNYSMTLTGLTEDTDYQYRAFVNSTSTGFTGNTLLIHTPSIPLTPSIVSKTGTTEGYLSGSTYYGKIKNSGGESIIRYADIEYYAVQYRKSGTTTWLYSPALPISGPLAVDNFIITSINALDANSIYEYRAYMTVAGVPYYGLIKTITTPSQPAAIPTVTTGTAGAVTESSFSVGGNQITDNGNPTIIQERGILWTTSGSLGTSTNLKWSTPLVSGIHNDSGGTTTTWTGNATGLTSNTTVYYRAYARNDSDSTSVGYGDVRSVQTSQNAEVYFNSIVSSAPRLAANNLNTQTLAIAIEYTVEADCDYITNGEAGNSEATTTLEVSLNGGSTWTTIAVAYASCSTDGSSDGYDDDIKNYTYVLNGITAANISNIRFRMTYDCSYDRAGKNGYVVIKIASITSDSGTANPICNNRFTIGCGNIATLSCDT